MRCWCQQQGAVMLALMKEIVLPGFA